MKIEEQLPFLKQLAKALAAQFGPQCEVVVHDLTKGTENTIAVIENGHVTGRRVGDGASRIVLRALNGPGADLEDGMGYLTRTEDGRLLRSSSVYLRDENSRAIALLSINYDFTELSHAASILGRFMDSGGGGAQDGIETISSSVTDMLDRLIDESARHVGKPVALMNKDDKVRAIRYLDEKGAFLIQKSSDKVSKYFDISKYTLYNYLNHSQ